MIVRWTETDHPGLFAVGISETLELRRRHHRLIKECERAWERANRYRDHASEIEYIRALDRLRRFEEEHEPKPAA